MIGVPAQGHKRTEAGHPLCGQDQLGYMWDKPEQVTCRACQIIMRHPELAADVKVLSVETTKTEIPSSASLLVENINHIEVE